MTWKRRAPTMAPMTPHIATEKVSSAVKAARTAQGTASRMPTRVPTAVEKPCQVICSGTPSHFNSVGSILIGIPPKSGMACCPPTAIIAVVGLFDWIGRRRGGRPGQTDQAAAWHVYLEAGGAVAEDGPGAAHPAPLGGARGRRAAPRAGGGLPPRS